MSGAIDCLCSYGLSHVWPHSRASVTTKNCIVAQNSHSALTRAKHWVLPAGHCPSKLCRLACRQLPDMEARAESSPYNRMEVMDSEVGGYCSGIGYNYVRESELAGVSAILKISQYPLPKRMVRKLATMGDRILVVNGQPVIEEAIKRACSAKTIRFADDSHRALAQRTYSRRRRQGSRTRKTTCHSIPLSTL